MKLHVAAFIAGLLSLASAVRAQTAFTIDLAQPRQTIEGLGFTATGTWIPEVRDLYARPDFAQQVGDDLAPSIVRLALPPAFQSAEDLDTATLSLEHFDAKAFSPPANFIQGLHNPSIKVMLTVWSPPAWMKGNNSTVKGGHLRADRRAHFGKYCAAACMLFEKEFGIPVYALSIQNEPDFVEPYDSCIYTPAEMRDTIKAVASAFQTFGVKARIMAPEDAHDTKRVVGFVDAIKADEKALAATSIINFHGIPSTGWPDLHDRIAPLKKQLWMTETSGESPDWNGGLAVATEIHNALTLGECSAWVYWALTDPSSDEFALMSLSSGTGKYWAAKHYFKFVRPDSIRIAVTPADADILVSAFINRGEHTLTIILVNLKAGDAEVALTLKDAPAGIKAFLPFRSTAADTCVPLTSIPVTADHPVNTALKARSVTTLQARFEAP